MSSPSTGNLGLQWIKELVRQEQNIEAEGKISLPNTTPSKEDLLQHTIEFMHQMRKAFTEQCAIFNHLKGFVGSVRIYGIDKTQADFMLFRHGHKMIFSVRDPGLISIRIVFNSQVLGRNLTSPINPTNDSKKEKQTQLKQHEAEPADFIKGYWAAFNELKWTYNDQSINIDYLIRYYFSLFVKNSMK